MALGVGVEEVMAPTHIHMIQRAQGDRLVVPHPLVVLLDTILIGRWPAPRMELVVQEWVVESARARPLLVEGAVGAVALLLVARIMVEVVGVAVQLFVAHPPEALEAAAVYELSFHKGRKHGYYSYIHAQ